jgi:hypothetical protein
MPLTPDFLYYYDLFSECEYDAPLEFIWRMVRASPNLFTGDMNKTRLGSKHTRTSNEGSGATKTVPVALAAPVAAMELHGPSFDDDDDRRACFGLETEK